MHIVRDTASVIVSEAVDGTKRRKPPQKGHRQPKVTTIKVDRKVWRAARKALKPNTEIRIISADCVRIVNKP